MAHVFISYHKQSSRNYARKLADHLIANGFDVWIDDRIELGGEWERAIFDAIDSAQALIVIMTRNAWDSVWVRRERTYAENRKLQIFPLRVEDYIFPPYYATQFLDVRKWQLPNADFFHTLEAAGVPRKSRRGEEIAVARQAIARKAVPSLPRKIEPPKQALAQSANARQLRGGKRNGFSWWIGAAVVIIIGVAGMFVVSILALILSSLPVPTTVPQGESTQASIAPTLVREDSDQIVFSSSRDGLEGIYLMNADGSNQTRLTSNSIVASAPTWSPDGLQIAFQWYVSTASASTGISIINADGMNQRQLISDFGVIYTLDWSPDGRQIVFDSTRDGSNTAIYVMNANGSNARRLTNRMADEASPTWSPDGRKIAFVSAYYTWDGEIFVMDADGSNVHPLTENVSGDTSPVHPAWSPDGNQIVFVAGDSYWEREIYVMNADGSNVRQLTHNSAEYSHPTWSIDGSQIAFASNQDGNTQIYVMNADGSNIRRLTNNTSSDQFPDWRP